MKEKNLVLALEIVFVLAVCLLITSFRNPELGDGDPFLEEQEQQVEEVLGADS
jgi:hypothetical protein